MKFIDLFSGIGGFRSALELSGHECIAYSEIDKYAKQSYQAMYDTENEIDLGDITNISQEYLSHFKQENDIVVGGSPCQSFSLAGSRKGFEDTRGTLFFEYAKVVKETQPKYFLFENVKGLMSHDKGNTIRVVLETFNELGYYIDFNVFNSKYYGVPQNRERIYIIGKRKDLVEQPKYHDKTKGKKKFDEIHNWAVDNINYVELLPQLQTEVTTRLIDVLEDEVDEKYYLSEEKTKKLTLNLSLTSQDRHGIAVREATKQGYAIAEQGDSVNVSYPSSKTRRGRVGKQVAQTLQAGEVNQGVVVDDTQGYDGVRYYKGIAPTLRSSRSGLKTIVAPKEESGEVNQGGVMEDKNIRFTDDGFHTHRNDKKKSSIQGTHVTYKEGKTHALTSNHVPMTLNNSRIRKLTPLECWRLQGFTDEQFYKAKESGVSNSQLYKQSGNAITISVADAIIKKITEG